MDLKEYFENVKGVGVLATSDSEGKVDVAIYARPHVMDGGEVAFIMPDRLTHVNLKSNPHAAYLFKEDGPAYKGKRLYLKKTREEEESELLYKIRRKCYPPQEEAEEGTKYLVFFTVEKELPLTGAAF